MGAMRSTSTAAAAAALVGVAMLAGCAGGLGIAGASDQVPTPIEFSPDVWVDLLGGDQELNLAVIEQAAQTSDVTGLADAQAQAFGVVAADVTGVNRERFDDYFTPGHTGQYCSDVEEVATLVAAMEVDTSLASGSDIGALWAKSLVLWTGACPVPPAHVTAGDPYTTTVYLRDRGDGWEPVREGFIPQRTVTRFVDPGEVPEWALQKLDGCAAEAHRVRLEVAAAWEVLCAAALDAGVAPTVTSSFRNTTEQRARFEAGVDIHGSIDTARLRVAFADDTVCTSRHCAGTALDVSTTSEVLAWLRTPVGCIDSVSAEFLNASDCAGSTRQVQRMERFGFTEPLPGSPGHLEFIFPLTRIDGGGLCAVPASSGVLDQITAAWECELTYSGIAAQGHPGLVARALSVAAQCSNLDTRWAFEGGVYSQVEDPRTSEVRTEAGLFALSAPYRTGFALPGEDPNSAAGQASVAARVYVAERNLGRNGWGVFGCDVDETFQWAREHAGLVLAS